MKDYNVPKNSITTTPRPEWARPPSTQSSANDAVLPELKPTTRKPTEAPVPTTSPSVVVSESTTVKPSRKPSRKPSKKPKPSRSTKVPKTTSTTTSTTTEKIEENLTEEEEEVNNEQDVESVASDVPDGRPNCQDPKYDEKFFPNLRDCEKFFRCNHGNVVEMSCESGLVFNIGIQTCDWPQQAHRKNCKLSFLKETDEDDVVSTTYAIDETTIVEESTDKTENEV